MKVDTKSVSVQILTWLTDTDRHQFRVGSHVTNTRLVWEIQVCVTNQTKCQSCLPVCSSKHLPPSRGEKTDMEYGYWHWPLLYCLVSTVVSQVLFVWNISKSSSKQGMQLQIHLNSYKQVWTPHSIIKNTIHGWSTFALLPIFNLCVLVCGWCLERRRLVIKIIEHSQLTRSD